MYRIWSLWIGLLSLAAANAQTTVIARVMDAQQGHPLPYATVLLMGTSRGTITNSEGWFGLPLQGVDDSLRISFIGYKTLVIPFTAALDGTHILLERAVHELAEAVVRPGEDLYARVVAASKWLRRAPEIEAKLFYGLETHSDEQPVELMHAYFSVTLKAAMITGLDFKRGKIGIAPKDDKHFINFNTARAFALLDVHARQSRFPLSPLAHTSRKALKQEFLVELIEAAVDHDGVDHLRATPRDPSQGAFTMDLWLAKGSAQVRAFELACTSCPRHPFIPLFPEGRIDSVDMRYRQTWTTEPPYLPQVMELAYNTAYTGPDMSDHFQSHAIMHAFDHGAPFIPTQFHWPDLLEEYRKIFWLPEDTIFWSRMTPPLPTEKQLKDHAFIAAHDLRNNAWYGELTEHNDLLRPVFIAWSPEDRLTYEDITGAWVRTAHGPPDPDRIQLYTRLYLEMDTAKGDLHWFSCAVFGPHRSVYLAKPLPWTDAFINIYFDLCEMERRKMEASLREPGMTVGKAVKIHTHHSRELNNRLDMYMKHTRNGSDRDALKPWDELVVKELGIANLPRVIQPVEQSQEHR